MTAYRRQQVQPPIVDGNGNNPTPAYLREDNQSNAVTLRNNIELGTVLCLPHYGLAYADQAYLFKKDFPRFEIGGMTKPADVHERIDGYLRDPDSKIPFLTVLLKAIGRYLTSKGNNICWMTWAAEWESLSPYLVPHKPHRWLQAVGKPTEESMWVTVVRYPLVASRKAPIKLYRPTQLDAGWFPHHFPSPPPTPLARGGHTMFLCADNEGRPGNGLVHEYIHQSFPFSIRHWYKGGQLLEVAGAVQGHLPRQRQKHIDLLEQHYPGEVEDWITVCK